MKFPVCLMLVCLTLASAATFTRFQVDPNAPAPNTDIPPPPPNPLPQTPYLQALERLIIGLADEAGIQAPANVTACLDENTAGYYLQFISQVLDQLSRKDWIELPETVYNFKEGTIPAVEACLASDIGVKSIWDAYGIADLSLVDLYVKFAAYAIGGNYDTLMQNLTDIHTVFERGQYDIVGKLAGQLIRTVVGYDTNAGQPAPSALFGQMRSTFLNTQRYNGRYNRYNEDENQNRGRYRNQNYEEDEDDENDDNDDNDDNGNYQRYQNCNYNDYSNYNNYNDDNEEDDEDDNQSQNRNRNQNRNGNGNRQNKRRNNDSQNYSRDDNEEDEDDDDEGQYQYQNYNNYNYNNNYDNGEDSYQNSGNGYDDFDRGDPAPDLVYNIFEGLAEAAGQSPPTAIKSCLNYISGRIILNFILNVVGEINDKGFERIPPTIGGFERAMPRSSMNCFAKNKDFKNLLTAYGIKEKTPQAFAKKLAKYGQTNDNMKITKITKQANRVLIDADTEDFEGVGQDSSQILKTVWKPNGNSQGGQQ